MNYIEYQFEVTPLQPGSEILIAQLAELGFESFVETDTGVLAYIPSKDWNPELINNLSLLHTSEFTISYHQREIPAENWNETWEKSFNPIVVDNECTVRAPFHEVANTRYDIVIEPKMSFGTGHHETTHMMLQCILQHDFNQQQVLDMGCGTAVLAILAEKKGAGPIDAIDNDPWCYQNATENIQKNNCSHITPHLGDASLLAGKNYHIILANINRNILLNDLQQYATCLLPSGKLFLSGFYLEDVPALESEANKYGLKLLETRTNNQWAAMFLQKISN